MANYGLPYMGSKNKIAEWVLSYLPKAENLYDLFCGGCAITHCAMVHNKYKNYIINDIKPIMPQLFVDCLNGKYKDENRWISREDFFKLKDIDGYVHTCFSFGGNGKDYIYHQKLESYKKALHYAVYYNDYKLIQKYGLDFSELNNIKTIHKKRLYIKKILQKYKEKIILLNIDSPDRLQSTERLERLQSISSNGNIINFNQSYETIEIKPNSVIYCDIPYKNTGTYNKEDFNYDKFYDWALRQTQPIFISEYNMPSDFIYIAEKERKSSMSPTNNSTKFIEKIFIPKHQKYNIVNKQQSLF